MSVEAATTALAAAKVAHKADKSNAGLKAAYKAAKAALAAATVAAEAKAAKKAAKSAKKKRKAEAVEPEPVVAVVDLASLQAALAAAKTAHKGNKADAGLKAAYKAAKQAVKDFEAKGETATEAVVAAPADDLLAGLMSNKKQKVAGNEAATGPKPSADHEGNPPSEKIFAGNLSFDIDDDSCKEWFADCGTLTDIYWLTDRDSGKFKGCGFLTFESIEQSAKAVAKNGTDCMGREIRLNYAQNKGNAKKKSFSKELSEKPEGCTTVFAGNLSFDIDDDKMREFAAGAGDVKNIRWLTDKASGEFKGCGFIEFYDGAAVDEFIKLNGTDCLGRSIRLDYAAPRPPRENAW